MRALLTGGIKAILAIAALSTAAHWALRVQRDTGGRPATAVASAADPVSTGSIEPRRTEPVPSASRPQQAAAVPLEPARAVAGLDQSHLAALMTSAGVRTADRAPAKAVAKPPAKTAKR